METKLRAAITERVYEELEPSTEWVDEEDWYTLLVYVSGMWSMCPSPFMFS